MSLAQKTKASIFTGYINTLCVSLCTTRQPVQLPAHPFTRDRPFFEPTAHRWSARAHYSRHCRYARALNAHMHRLPLDILREVRLLGVRCIFPLAVAAFIHLPTARVSVFGHPIGAAVRYLTSCRYDHSRAMTRILNSNMEPLYPITLKGENTLIVKQPRQLPHNQRHIADCGGDVLPELFERAFAGAVGDAANF